MKKFFLILVALFGMAALFAASETGQKKYIGKDGSVSVTLTTPFSVVEQENEAKGAAVDGADIGKYIGRDGAASITLLSPPPPEMEEAAAGEKDGLDEIQKMAQKVLALAQKKAGTDFKKYTGAYNSSSINIMPPTIELKNGYVFTYMHDGDSSPERHDIECWGFAVGQGESYVPDKEMIKKVRLTGKIYGWKGLLSHIGQYGHYYAEEIEKVFSSEDKVKEWLSDYEKASDEIAEILKCFK